MGNTFITAVSEANNMPALESAKGGVATVAIHVGREPLARADARVLMYDEDRARSHNERDHKVMVRWVRRRETSQSDQCWPMETIDAIFRCFYSLLSMAYGVTGLEDDMKPSQLEKPIPILILGTTLVS